MKRSVVTVMIVLLVVGVGGAFAAGQEESSDFPYGPSRSMGRGFYSEDFEQPELVTVTGRVAFDDGFPTITAEGKTYDVMVPRYYADDVDVDAGATITVQGYLMNADTSPRLDEDDLHIMVTKATIGGEVYEIDIEHGPMGMMWDDDHGRFSDDDDFRRAPRGRSPRGGRW